MFTWEEAGLLRQMLLVIAALAVVCIIALAVLVLLN
jgi:hypothetical protein